MFWLLNEETIFLLNQHKQPHLTAITTCSLTLEFRPIPFQLLGKFHQVSQGGRVPPMQCHAGREPFNRRFCTGHVNGDPSVTEGRPVELRNLSLSATTASAGKRSANPPPGQTLLTPSPAGPGRLAIAEKGTG